jgi:hypothetical protein
MLAPLEVSVHPSIVLSRPRFWLEVLISCLHLPPFVTFELGLTNWSNFVLYRGETLGALWGTLKVYHLWRWLRVVFVHTIPRRHTIASFTGIQLDTIFSLKQMLSARGALRGICATWALTLVILGYWLRAVENTACQFGLPHPTALSSHASAEGPQASTALHARCLEHNARFWTVHSIVGEQEKVNDPYLWNFVWYAFSTSTTVGYGDVHASTWAGRALAMVTSVFGLLTMALLTSQLMTKLSYTPEEVRASLMLDRARAESTLLSCAAKFVSSWWLFRKLSKAAPSAATAGARLVLARYRLHLAKKAFCEARRWARRDLEELSADSVKIDQVAARTRHLLAAASTVQQLTGATKEPRRGGWPEPVSPASSPIAWRHRRAGGAPAALRYVQRNGAGSWARLGEAANEGS